MEEVKAVFNSFTTTIFLNRLVLYIKPSGDFIPADFLGNSVTASFDLSVIGTSNSTSLRVDPDALRSSKFWIKEVEFLKLDMSQVDFQFLTGGIRVYSLYFKEISNPHLSLPTIPALPGLVSLFFKSSSGFNQEWQNGNVFLQSGRLKEFYASECDLDEFGMGQLLDWLLPYSAGTLRDWLFYENRIGSIPRQLSLFQKLTNIYINRNSVELVMQSNSFDGTSNYTFPKTIDLRSSQVVRVEPDCFLGNYSSTKVILNDNLLTRLEEDVFKSMLQYMAGGEGYLAVSQNPFDCYSDPCHLAWLLRDNRDLLNEFSPGPQCANGTFFRDLSPSLFQDCP